MAILNRASKDPFIYCRELHPLLLSLVCASCPTSEDYLAYL